MVYYPGENNVGLKVRPGIGYSKKTAMEQTIMNYRMVLNDIQYLQIEAIDRYFCQMSKTSRRCEYPLEPTRKAYIEWGKSEGRYELIVSLTSTVEPEHYQRRLVCGEYLIQEDRFRRMDIFTNCPFYRVICNPRKQISSVIYHTVDIPRDLCDLIAEYATFERYFPKK